MGAPNLDRVPIQVRRRKCETVSQMIEQGWDVVSACRKCGLKILVDLPLVLQVSGDISLWNRTWHCKRLGCIGFVDFLAKAPGMAWFERLSGPDTSPPVETLGDRREADLFEGG